MNNRPTPDQQDTRRGAVVLARLGMITDLTNPRGFRPRPRRGPGRAIHEPQRSCGPHPPSLTEPAPTNTNRWGRMDGDKFVRCRTNPYVAAKGLSLGSGQASTPAPLQWAHRARRGHSF